MTVVFTSIVQGYPGCQRYAGLNDAIKAARAFSGCPVRIITNDPELKGPEVIRIISVSMPVPCSKNGNLNFSSIARWFLLCDQMWAGNIEPPVFTPDWDVLIFSDLREACAPFLKYDFASCFFENGRIVAPMLINSILPLESFCQVALLKQEWTEHDHDMVFWDTVHKDRRSTWSVGNLSLPADDTVFDPGMHQQVPGFALATEANESKRLVWKDHKPHFVTPQGKLVRAHTIHCWGSYKNRTAELLGRAGL
jgi:hypothetical protein